MNKEKIAYHLEQIVAELRKGDSQPTAPVPTQPIQPPVVLPPTGDKIKCLITFVGSGHTWTPPVDVVINGQLHHFYGREKHDPRWNQELHGSRGQIIEVNSPITSVRFLEGQVFDSNHIDFNYKVGAVHSDTDMTIQNESVGSPNYWVRWFRVNNDPNQELADHTSVRGSISGRVNNPFYHYDNIPQGWSRTGQFRIIIWR